MKSQKHINWREEQQKDHKQKYGHCISAEKIIETLRKEIREYKKTHASSVEIINKKDEKLSLLSKKLDDVSVENDLLKVELEETQEEPESKEVIAELRANLDKQRKDNEEYEKDLIAAHKARDKLQQEVNTRKLVTIRKKSAPSLEQPRFR